MKANKTRTSAARTGEIAFVLLVLIQLFFARETAAIPYQRTLRLCSRSLSDALFLVCKGRGFNEPFSYSNEETDDEGRRNTSTIVVRRSGLVQECCHRACSIEQLERYCKPLPQPARQEDAASRGNAIASKPSSATYKIVSLPYSSVKKFQVASLTPASIIPDHQTRRAPRRKRRKKGRWKYAGECRCRRQKRRRKSWRKVSRETVIPKVPAFQVGTTSPEPIDSIVIFPFKSELLGLERIDSKVGTDREDLNRSR